jgi:integrase/recombinase XerD
MNLSQAVDLYIQRRQSAGSRFYAPAAQLRSFSRQCGEVALRSITPTHVSKFLNHPRTLPTTWCKKHGTLRVFFEYWTLRRQMKTAPLPPSVPKCPQTFVPYIYTRSELRLLLDATPRSQRVRSCVMSPATFRTMLLFLYGTGARLGEALKLRITDVDLRSGVVTITGTKFYKSRLVPLGRDVLQLIRQYLLLPATKDQDYRPLFQTKMGEPIKLQAVDKSFARLRRLAGIVRHDVTPYQPRVHDLRHTFAVHRLTAWYKEGSDVQRLLPGLSTYLGHVDLQSTQRYLTMTPELLQQANHRFERYVCGGHDDR